MHLDFTNLLHDFFLIQRSTATLAFTSIKSNFLVFLFEKNYTCLKENIYVMFQYLKKYNSRLIISSGYVRKCYIIIIIHLFRIKHFFHSLHTLQLNACNFLSYFS